MKEEVLHDSTITSVVKQMLKSEMELVSQFLLLDERNFHCWNYRRFIVALLGTTTITATATTTTQEAVSTATVTNDAASSLSLNHLLPLLYSGSWSSWLGHNNTTTTTTNQQQQTSLLNVVSMGAQ
jgi:hypothetical protein